MKTIITILTLHISMLSFSQITISGKAQTDKGEPLPGVNIFIENSYDGASSDADGNFKFKTSEIGSQILKATFIGYKAWQREISISENIEIRIDMKESVNTIDAVTITAGSFAAADESRASIMKSLKIVIYITDKHELIVENNLQPKNTVEPSSKTGLANLAGRYEFLTGKKVEIVKNGDYFRVSLPLIKVDNK